MKLCLITDKINHDVRFVFIFFVYHTASSEHFSVMNKGMVTDFGEKWEESFQGFFLYWLGRFGSVNLWGSCVVSYCV